MKSYTQATSISSNVRDFNSNLFGGKREEGSEPLRCHRFLSHSFTKKSLFKSRKCVDLRRFMFPFMCHELRQREPGYQTVCFFFTSSVNESLANCLKLICFEWNNLNIQKDLKAVTFIYILTRRICVCVFFSFLGKKRNKTLITYRFCD